MKHFEINTKTKLIVNKVNRCIDHPMTIQEEEEESVTFRILGQDGKGAELIP